MPITSLTNELSPDAVDYFKRMRVAESLAVFGAARLALDVGNLPSTDQIDDLTWQIESLTTGPKAELFHGNYRRTLTGDRTGKNDKPLELTWNPAGISHGFGDDISWDRAMGHIGNIAYGKQAIKTGHRPFPKKFNFTEGLYIDRETAQPIIRRSLWTTRGNYSGRRGSKLANANEVRETSALLQRFNDIDTKGNEELSHDKPLYLEIGYGLDPVPLRGRRRFDSKAYLGIDSATGNYVNPIGEYGDAVLAESTNFANFVEDKKKGEYISFSTGDAQKLPLPAHSVREVFMSNVINTPLDNSVRSNILTEARRVLGQNGNLVVRVNWQQEDWPESKMIGLLKRHGFWIVKTVSKSDVEYSNLEAQYGTPKQVSAPKGYYLIVQPEHSDVTK